jgi:hypothetical protein
VVIESFETIPVKRCTIFNEQTIEIRLSIRVKGALPDFQVADMVF